MSQGAVANTDENHIRATLSNEELDSASAIEPIVSDEFGRCAFSARNHDPFGLAEMRGHRRIGPAGRHHYRNSAHKISLFR
jgi:hypothetical protein